MKIISLNTWGGRAGKEKLLAFFEKHKETTDVFCLQEIWSAPYEDLENQLVGGNSLHNKEAMVYGLQEISGLLSGHTSYFRPHLLEDYGLMMLVKKNLTVSAEGELFVHKHKGYAPPDDVGKCARNIQYVTMENHGKPLTVINFHGLWNGQGKTDTEDRINQTKRILEFTTKLEGSFVLCGDFNLLPDTESIRLFEEAGLRNLIKEYKITSTRTSYYTKPERHADYTFVTKDIHIKDFKVLPDEVSDHAALLIEF